MGKLDSLASKKSLFPGTLGASPEVPEIEIDPKDPSSKALHHLRQDIAGHGHDDQGGEAYHPIVDDLWFHVLVNVMVLFNTIQMGFEADYPEWTEAWKISENLFVGIFFFEMVVKLIILRKNYFMDRTNWLDGGLTVLGVLDTWMLSNLLEGGGTDLQSLSVLRILRLARLARILKLIREFRPLVLVIRGVVQTLSTTMYVFGFLCVIFYVFAIFLTDHLGKSPETDLYPGYFKDEVDIDTQEIMVNYNPYVHFGSMTYSMLTLFNMAILAEWPEIVRPIALKQPIYVPIFIAFALLVSFGVINVMTGLILDTVIAESKRIDEVLGKKIRMEKLKKLEAIQTLLCEMDTNGDGQISIKELDNAMKTSPLLNSLLKSINLPSAWKAEELLDMLDNSGHRSLERDEFTTRFFRLMVSDSFQQIAILQTGINQLKQTVFGLESKMTSRFDEVSSDMAKFFDAMRPGAHSQTPEPSRSEQQEDKQADHVDLAKYMGSAANDLEQRIKALSQKQFTETMDVAYSAMNAAYAAAKEALCIESNFPQDFQEMAIEKQNVNTRVTYTKDSSWLAQRAEDVSEKPRLSNARLTCETDSSCVSTVAGRPAERLGMTIRVSADVETTTLFAESRDESKSQSSKSGTKGTDRSRNPEGDLNVVMPTTL